MRQFFDGLIDNCMHSLGQRCAAVVRIQALARWYLVHRLRTLLKKRREVRLLRTRHCREDAALVLQCAWRGYVARQVHDSLLEEVCWLLKPRFEFSSTVKQTAHVEVSFHCNPGFDAERSAMSIYGDPAPLKAKGKDRRVDKEVVACIRAHDS